MTTSFCIYIAAETGFQTVPLAVRTGHDELGVKLFFVENRLTICHSMRGAQY